MSNLWTPRAGNVLTYGQATFEDGSTGNSYFSATHGTLANSTAQACSGTRSLAITYADNGSNRAMEVGQTVRPPVVPGQVYTAVAAVRSDQASGETFQVRIYSYTTAGASTMVVSGATTEATSAGWTVLSVTAVMPANAATATVSVMRVAGVAGAVAYVDQFGLWAGAGGMWAPPGVPVTGIGHKTDNTAGKATYLWDETVPGWRLAVYDSGWRDVSAALEAGASGTLLIRRTATNVHVLSFNVTNSSGTIYIAPAGFAPGSGTDGIAAPVVKFDGTVGAMTFNSPSGGHMALSAGIKAYAGAYLSAVFPVRTAIPTSLPGTQATAPV